MRKKIIILASIIFLVSALARFWPYESDITNRYVFDEAFYIPQALSYVKGDYYFNIHPPLGKFFIYQGIRIFNPHIEEKLAGTQSSFYAFDNFGNINLEGARLFPRIFGSLLPLIVFFLVIKFFHVFYLSLGRLHIFLAGAVGLLLAIENMLIVESRFALLSPTYLFFAFLALLLLLFFCHEPARRKKIAYLLFFSLAWGLAISTKWYGFLILPLFVVAVFSLKDEWKAKLIYFGISFMIVLFTYISIYYWHFSKLHNFIPNPEAAKAIPVDVQFHNEVGRATIEQPFLGQMKQQLIYTFKYQQAMEKADAKSSRWYQWPTMTEPFVIKFTYQLNKDLYDVNKQFLKDIQLRPIYIIGNPIIWFISLWGAVFGFICLFVGKNKQFFIPIKILFLAYVVHWVSFVFVSNKMYLYTYAPSLIFGLILFIIFLLYITEYILHNKFLIHYILVCLMVTSLVLFFFFAPLTYGSGLTILELQGRELLPQWGLIEKVMREIKIVE